MIHPCCMGWRGRGFDPCYSLFLFSIVLIIFWLNCSFSPLTFPKLRFWPPKKKTTKQPPKFCNCSSFGPQGKKKIKKITRGTSLRVSRQRRLSQYQLWGPKLLQLQNLGDCFLVFFLRGPKSQLWES